MVERAHLDLVDREIVLLLQDNADRSVREIADLVGLTATPCWRRIQRLETDGVIAKRVALMDPASLNVGVTVLVEIRTNRHSAEWLAEFREGIETFPEIVEAYRMSGEIDYLLKVVVPDIAAYDDFYRRLIEVVDLYDVRSSFAMERMKVTTALPLDYV